MKKIIHNLMGWQGQKNLENIIHKQTYVRTIHPLVSLSFEEWMKQLNVGRQFTFMDKNHYTRFIIKTVI